MSDAIRRLDVYFYCTTSGNNPVREWLKSLPAADRRIIGRDLLMVELGWPVGMPLCRPLGDGLWEVRSTLPSRRISRILFCVSAGRMMLLHAFIKKTQKTPGEDLEIARSRKKEL